MMSFELSGYRRANVWLDELPPVGFLPTSLNTNTVLGTGQVTAFRQMVAVELYVPHGPTVSYALLGADIVPKVIDGLEIVVGVSEGGPPYPSALASKVDQVKIGLPSEYATAVAEGAMRVVELGGGPVNASLRFRWAAHGVVGSSRAIFRRASEILVRLLVLPVGAADEQIRLLLE
jgi:hypothetical protein